MFRKNNTEQKNLFDPINELTPYHLKLIEKSWAGYFRENIFYEIDEEKFHVLYSDKASRPNTPVNIMIGLLIIKAITGLTDEELIESMIFDLRFKYALHTTSEVRQPISKNMFTNFRNSLIEYEIETGIDLVKEEIERLSKQISECIKSDKTLKRIDSMMVSSSCKSLSRINLVFKVNENFIEKVEEIKTEVLLEKFKEYLTPEFKKEKIYGVTKSNHQQLLENLLKDSQELYNEYKENEKINKMKEFELLERLIKEQFDEENNGPKNSKSIRPDSMQNPSDPDATYRYKYGNNVGYVANIEEEIKGDNVFITGYDFQKNIYSDQQFMKDYIEEKDGNDAETILVDAAYFSDEIKKKAEEKNITLIPTQTMGGKKIDTIITEFEIDENKKEIISCPNKEKPIKTKYLENMHILTANFDKEKCMNCPFKEKCEKANIIKKKVSSVRFSIESYHKAEQEKIMNTEEYKKISNKRAGIEGTPSVLRRRYNVDNLPIKGLLRSKMWFGFDILAINIKKGIKYTNTEIKSTSCTGTLKKLIEITRYGLNFSLNFFHNY